MKVAYFSMEFGLHESLPVYSGGLGILAGGGIKGGTVYGATDELGAAAWIATAKSCRGISSRSLLASLRPHS